jgi:hypothetical protein
MNQYESKVRVCSKILYFDPVEGFGFVTCPCTVSGEYVSTSRSYS